MKKNEYIIKLSNNDTKDELPMSLEEKNQYKKQGDAHCLEKKYDWAMECYKKALNSIYEKQTISSLELYNLFGIKDLNKASGELLSNFKKVEKIIIPEVLDELSKQDFLKFIRLSGQQNKVKLIKDGFIEYTNSPYIIALSSQQKSIITSYFNYKKNSNDYDYLIIILTSLAALKRKNICCFIQDHNEQLIIPSLSNKYIAELSASTKDKLSINILLKKVGNKQPEIIKLKSKQRDWETTRQQLLDKKVKDNTTHQFDNLILGAMIFALEGLKKYSEALDDYFFFSLNNLSISHLENMLNALFANRQYKQALGYCDQIIKTNPKSINIQYIKAQAYFQQKQYQEAEECYQEILDLIHSDLYKKTKGEVELRFVTYSLGKDQTIYNVFGVNDQDKAGELITNHSDQLKELIFPVIKDVLKSNEEVKNQDITNTCNLSSSKSKPKNLLIGNLLKKKQIGFLNYLQDKKLVDETSLKIININLENYNDPIASNLVKVIEEYFNYKLYSNDHEHVMLVFMLLAKIKGTKIHLLSQGDDGCLIVPTSSNEQITKLLQLQNNQRPDFCILLNKDDVKCSELLELEKLKDSWLKNKYKKYQLEIYKNHPNNVKYLLGLAIALSEQGIKREEIVNAFAKILGQTNGTSDNPYVESQTNQVTDNPYAAAALLAYDQYCLQQVLDKISSFNSQAETLFDKSQYQLAAKCYEEILKIICTETYIKSSSNEHFAPYIFENAPNSVDDLLCLFGIDNIQEASDALIAKFECVMEQITPVVKDELINGKFLEYLKNSGKIDSETLGVINSIISEKNWDYYSLNKEILREYFNYKNANPDCSYHILVLTLLAQINGKKICFLARGRGDDNNLITPILSSESIGNLLQSQYQQYENDPQHVDYTILIQNNEKCFAILELASQKADNIQKKYHRPLNVYKNPSDNIKYLKRLAIALFEQGSQREIIVDKFAEIFGMQANEITNNACIATALSEYDQYYRQQCLAKIKALQQQADKYLTQKNYKEAAKGYKDALKLVLASKIDFKDKKNEKDEKNENADIKSKCLSQLMLAFDMQGISRKVIIKELSAIFNLSPEEVVDNSDIIFVLQKYDHYCCQRLLKKLANDKSVELNLTLEQIELLPLTDSDSNELFDQCLLKRTNLKKISLYNNPLNPTQFKSLLIYLAKNTLLESINLNGCKLTDEQFSELVKTLEDYNFNLTNYCSEGQNMGDLNQQNIQIGQVINRNQQLKKLNSDWDYSLYSQKLLEQDLTEFNRHLCIKVNVEIKHQKVMELIKTQQDIIKEEQKVNNYSPSRDINYNILINNLIKMWLIASANQADHAECVNQAFDLHHRYVEKDTTALISNISACISSLLQENKLDEALALVGDFYKQFEELISECKDIYKSLLNNLSVTKNTERLYQALEVLEQFSTKSDALQCEYQNIYESLFEQMSDEIDKLYQNNRNIMMDGSIDNKINESIEMNTQQIKKCFQRIKKTLNDVTENKSFVDPVNINFYFSNIYLCYVSNEAYSIVSNIISNNKKGKYQYVNNNKKKLADDFITKANQLFERTQNSQYIKICNEKQQMLIAKTFEEIVFKIVACDYDSEKNVGNNNVNYLENEDHLQKKLFEFMKTYITNPAPDNKQQVLLVVKNLAEDYLKTLPPIKVKGCYFKQKISIGKEVKLAKFIDGSDERYLALPEHVKKWFKEMVKYANKFESNNYNPNNFYQLEKEIDNNLSQTIQHKKK